MHLMNTAEQIKLIEGIYSEKEAREILMNVISTKIHFHGMKNFSSKERFGKEDPASLKRITELNKDLVKINELLLFAKENKLNISLHSTIHISVSAG